MTTTFVGFPPFPKAARTALADTQLRTNLRRATATIRAKTGSVIAERPDWQELRTAGAAAKDRALDRLDEVLELAERQVQAAGGFVHWARDATEACEIVGDIAQSHGVHEVVKVKSMATQEIELNESLATRDIAAIETDLAELIVQLGHDQPSHILVPAIHRNRAEIREIFRREMGKVGRPAPDDLTDEPTVLAEAARLHLREKFLSAKLAISGGNFLVAETGSVVVLESEGNGRMCLTLPEVLVSVVGIEKVVPTWDDLAVLLELLPRASTGERMNPYTSVWTGVHAGDGPREFHLVLLDNGRTDVLADGVGRQALRCIRCSACLNVCPVYERAGGHAYGSVYPGPIGAILTPQLRGIHRHPVDAQTASLPYASSLCGACFDACPVKIDIPRVLIHLRGVVVDAKREHKVPGGERLAMAAMAKVFDDPRNLAAMQRAAKLARPMFPRGKIGPWPGPSRGWTDARDAPRPPAESFRAWWARTRGEAAGPTAVGGGSHPGAPAEIGGAPPAVPGVADPARQAHPEAAS